MRLKLKSLRPKWYLFGALVLLGLVLYFLCPGYTFSGLCALALAALVPLFHLLGKVPKPNLRRRLIGMLSFCLAIFSLAAAVTGCVIASSAKGSQDPSADYLIVLGAGVNGTVPSRSLRERIDAAYAYLTEYPNATAIVSGGQGNGENITEAACMYRELTDLGIDPERIWMEDQATTTLENLRFSLALIGEESPSVAIVSSEYHLHRAGMFAQRLGIDAKLVPAKTGIIPLRMNYYLREIFAVWYYSIFGGSTNA